MSIKLAVIGHPIQHSKSPVMHTAALRKVHIDGSYVALDILPEYLGLGIKKLISEGYLGFNVTIPHKQNIIYFLDEIEPMAKCIGAVNTVKICNGRLFGYNTDAYGFIKPLLDRDFSLENANVIILGAGGASRAIICALLEQKVGRIIIGVRNTIKAHASLTDLLSSKVAIYDWNSEEFKKLVKIANLVVNTTPLGMDPNINEMPPIELELLNNKALIYDLIYNPATTLLLKKAQALNLDTLNGAPMLVYQGAKSFNIWTGIEPDINVMTTAISAV